MYRRGTSTRWSDIDADLKTFRGRTTLATPSTTDPQDAIIQYESIDCPTPETRNPKKMTIVLEADVLFQANSWELPENASQVIETLGKTCHKGCRVNCRAYRLPNGLRYV